MLLGFSNQSCISRRVGPAETCPRPLRLHATIRNASHPMNIETLHLLLAAATVLAALAVGAVCAVGLVVWLAGGKLDAGKRHKLV